MKISIVTDELSRDPETAFELGLEWGVDHFELRGIHDDRIPRLTPHARHRLARAVRDFGVSVTAVSPGLFKMPFPVSEPARANLGWMDAGYFDHWRDARAVLDDHINRLLPETIGFAEEVGAKAIICFSFVRAGVPGGEAPGAVIDVLRSAADQCASAGIELLVETEEGHWADTGSRSADLIRRVDNPAIGINWDPANALIEGDTPYPDGYGFVKAMVRNVHFKDARRYPDGRWELLADGDVDWEGQISALIADGYRGSIGIEHHLAPSVAYTRQSLTKLRRLIEPGNKL